MNSLKNLGTAIYQAGFDAFEIIPAAPVEKMLPILEEAQRERRCFPFVPPDPRARIEPRTLQKSARSIICLAVNYYTGEPGPAPALHGTISRSAWGKDYHLVLDEGMEQVISYLKLHYNAEECTKAADTSCLVDRALAIESGLGYPAANCSVYVPPFGSWVFLAEILVDAPLPYTKSEDRDNWSKPIECEACIKACPTAALLAPGKIDPQRCLSYLTQKSGAIPLEFREKLGNRLWGCDSCQAACPRNKAVPLSRCGDFLPLSSPHIDLIALLEMDRARFEKAFAQTSLAWRGKNVLQRNACIVLGNQRAAQAVPVLVKTSQEHASPIVREAARWATEKIKNQR